MRKVEVVPQAYSVAGAGAPLTETSPRSTHGATNTSTFAVTLPHPEAPCARGLPIGSTATRYRDGGVPWRAGCG